MTSLFPHRSTPELRHLQVSLGGEFSYCQAAKLLRQFLPDSDSFNHATIRNRVLEIGQQSEAETVAEISERSAATNPAENMVEGSDGAYVAATRTRMQRQHFEVVLGRIEVPDCNGEIFAAVRDLDGSCPGTHSIGAAPSWAGYEAHSPVRRGRRDATSGRGLVERTMEHQLDWFHLDRRISWM
ncbi:hypothetical protein JQK88_34945 [Mesorhizobium caraganae]|uniref:hypothetical protein n=1 Tax=Mesorhizobium caraganae TaxID=483206 RepID=UPI001939BB49|nr:hypothetical protein [Mesorhizobium caraganae]MBM2716265.1 hypothetical protein [Mesorhizobium caraganae]